MSRLVRDMGRYGIYELIGCVVGFKYKDRDVRGTVTDVGRGFFEKTLEIIIAGERFSFPEPDLIERVKDGVELVYGDLEQIEMTDEELFEQARDLGYSESVNDIIKRTSSSRVIRTLIKTDDLK